MDGRRTCLVVGLVVAGVAAGGTVASAVPDKGPGSDSGNHYGQLKHDTTTPTQPAPGPGPAAVAPPTSPAVTATAPSETGPPPTATQAAPSVPKVIPGTVDKKLALPDLPKPGDIPAVPPGSIDATSQMVITSRPSVYRKQATRTRFTRAISQESKWKPAGMQYGWCTSKPARFRIGGSRFVVELPSL